MKRISISACLVSCALFAFQSGYAQANKNFVMMPHHAPSTPQGMEGGMWRTDANFESILHLKNVLINRSVTVTPTLYMEDGTPYQLPPVTLEPAGVASVNISTALNDMPSTIAAHRSLYGMVGVKYNWSWPAAIMATVRSIDEAEMVSFESSLHADVNTSHSKAAAQKLQQIEGLWWKPYDSTNGFLFLLNTLLKTTQVTIAAFDSSGALLGQQTLTIGSQMSIRLALWSALGKQPMTGATGSLKITYQGPMNGISAVGGLEDDTNGYSATFNLQELHPEHARNLAVHQVVLDAPGVMLGVQEPQMQFPENTVFTPYGYVHNSANQARQLTVTITAAGSKGPQTYAVGVLTLAPNATQAINYKDALKALGLPPAAFIDISVAYAGNDGDIQMEEGSVDQTGNYVFQVEPEVEGWTISRTICHWELHDETDTMISLWNYSATAEDLTLTLYYSGGQYVVPLHLEPRADYELDIATLVHSAKDAQGHLIPQSITEGSALLSSAQGDPTHIFVAASTGVFNVRTGTCGLYCETCNGVSEVVFDPTSPFDVGLSSSVQASAQLTYNTGGVTSTTSGTWSSSNTSVAPVNTTGMVQRASVGAANIELAIIDLPAPAGYICIGQGGCPVFSAGPSGQANVPPTLSSSNSLWFFGVGITPPSGFTPGGIKTTITANNASGGSYQWTITSGTAKASFASGSSVSSTTTTNNNVTLYSIGSSTARNDVTVQLAWTPSGESAAATATLSLSIDSPYKLASNGATTNRGVGTSCQTNSPSGTNGFQSLVPYKIYSFFGVVITNIAVNEDFATQTDDYIGNTWPTYLAGSFVTPDGTFVDNICTIGPSLTPPTLPPQNPLTSTKLDHASQYWFVGSTTSGSGIEVQGDTLQRYQDHGLHTAITSPTR